MSTSSQLHSKKISEQPGMVLIHSRWHQTHKDEPAGNHPGSRKKTDEQREQPPKDGNSSGEAASSFARNVLSGAELKTSEWKEFLGEPKGRQKAIIREIVSQDGGRGRFTEAVAKFRAAHALHAASEKKEQKSGDKHIHAERLGEPKKPSPQHKQYQKKLELQHARLKKDWLDSLSLGEVPARAGVNHMLRMPDREYESAVDGAAIAYSQYSGVSGDDAITLGRSVVDSLVLYGDGPHEGDTKTVNGHTYVLQESRWHRRDSSDTEIQDDPQTFGHGTVTFSGPMPFHELLAARSTAWQTASGPAFSVESMPDTNGWLVSPSGVADDADRRKAQWYLQDMIPDGATVDFAGVQTIVRRGAYGKVQFVTKNGTSIAEFPGKQADITALVEGLWMSNANIIPPGHTMGLVAKNKREMERAVVTQGFASSKTKATGQGAESSFNNIDDWEQVGPQHGQVNGGMYADEQGLNWYCKFPNGGEAEVDNEILAMQLYRASGIAVPDVKKVYRDGTPGIAALEADGSIRDDLKLMSGKAKGIAHGFAVDAWLANPTVVDDIVILQDGSAMRSGASGALLYAGNGSLKGEAFGDVSDDMRTMLDAKAHPRTAKVFSKMKQSDVRASVSRLAKLSDDSITDTVLKFGPGSPEDRKKLAEKLIRRKNNILSKFKGRKIDTHDVETKKDAGKSGNVASNIMDYLNGIIVTTDHNQMVGKYINSGTVADIDDKILGLYGVEKVSVANGKLTIDSYKELSQKSSASLSHQQINAIYYFTDGGHQGIARAIRSGHYQYDKPTKLIVDAMRDHAHDLIPGSLMSRCIQLDEHDLKQLISGDDGNGMVGHVLEETSLASTSLSPDIWIDYTNVQFKITVGHGVKGLWTGKGSLKEGGTLSVNAQEKEVILPLGTRMLVRKITKTDGERDADGFGACEYLIDVVLLPTKQQDKIA